VVLAAKTFILDTLGVAIAGTTGPKAAELAAAQALWGRGDEARIWGSRTRSTATGAAFCNAYQAHCSEFDCVHEAAVIHVVTVVLPVALAAAERLSAAGKSVTGAQLVEAVVVGVDVAASLGIAARAGLRFFRPATAGTLGAAAAMGKLMGFDNARIIHAMSIAYGQVSGTMQAHTEGSMLLAMQMGFAARNAVVACDLAGLGFEGPRNILEGPFGYFRLIEDGGDPARVAQDLGRVWRIAEVAHKPFPSGRATHGVVDGCLELRSRHGFAANDVACVEARVPPLVHHLVGRPPKPVMAINYARLCAAYVAACALQRGTVSLADFRPEAYADSANQDLARRIVMTVRDVGNPNALTPIEVEVTLHNDARYSITVDAVYGNPAKPMSRAAHLQKFRDNWSSCARPLKSSGGEALIGTVDTLDRLGDARLLVDLMEALSD
jgi:2-methylcitrate dehydratase PrpD